MWWRNHSSAVSKTVDNVAVLLATALAGWILFMATSERLRGSSARILRGCGEASLSTGAAVGTGGRLETSPSDSSSTKHAS